MPQPTTLHHRAVTAAVLVSAVWSSSFVLVKMLLPYGGPLTIAALRYFLAFLVLLPIMLIRSRRGQTVLPASRGLWMKLFALGLSAYAIGNAALFFGLQALPATTVSFLFNFNPLLVLVGSLFWLKESPTRGQIVGLVVVLAGSALFFSPGLEVGEARGIAIVCLGLLSFAAFGILGREVARERQLDSLTLTAIPLGFGGGLLLVVALITEGVPNFPLWTWGVIAWLAVVNTALGYILYYQALQRLTALEMNIILDLGPLGTALLAWFLLDEVLGPIRIVGMIVVILGVILTQFRRSFRGPPQDLSPS